MGKKMPEISIKGNEIIRENKTAIPSFSVINPIMNPIRVSIIPTNKIKDIVGIIGKEYFAPVTIKSKTMVIN